MMRRIAKVTFIILSFKSSGLYAEFISFFDRDVLTIYNNGMLYSEFLVKEFGTSKFFQNAIGVQNRDGTFRINLRTDSGFYILTIFDNGQYQIRNILGCVCNIAIDSI